LLLPAVLLPATGCQSPYHRDQLAAIGALTGAGVGALIGEDRGNAASGAAIGSVVGAATGAVVGDRLDEIDARNQELIQARLGRRLHGASTKEDVIAMSRAGLSDDVIITHIRVHGVASPPSADDLIVLKNQGVSDAVLQAMQQTPPPTQPVAIRDRPVPPVIVEEHYYHSPRPWGWPPPCRHPIHHRHRHRHRPGWHFGFSLSD